MTCLVREERLQNSRRKTKVLGLCNKDTLLKDPNQRLFFTFYFITMIKIGFSSLRFTYTSDSQVWGCGGGRVCGVILSLGDTCNVWRHFWLAQQGEGCYWHLAGKGQGSANCTGQNHNQELCPPKGHSDQVGKPPQKVFSHQCLTLGQENSITLSSVAVWQEPTKMLGQ